MKEVNGTGTPESPLKDSSDVLESESSSVDLNDRDAPSAGTRKRQKQEDLIKRLIAEAKLSGASTLDLSNKGIKIIPTELLELTQLQYLYLEGNQLKCLPENFFDCLSNLRWLDLRRNYLVSIPSTYIGRHTNLRNLLLEGNALSSLPLELGLIKTLNGLNINNNPLEFPPSEVIDRGTQVVLQFLRDLLAAKSQGKLPNTVPRIEDLKLQDTQSEAGSTDSEEWYSSDINQEFNHARKYSSDSGMRPSVDMYSSRGSLMSDASDLVGPVPQSASLHKPPDYSELKQKHMARIKRAGATGKVDKKQRHSKKVKKVTRYPSPPPPDRVEQRFLEERRLAQLRELKEKQELTLQRRRDHEALREWRDDGKRLQQEKYRESYLYGGAKEPVDIAEKAPYGVDKVYMRVQTNEERIKEDVRAAHEQMRRPVSPQTQIRVDQERAARDRELERKIKTHTVAMQERRRKPKGTPQQEMEAAKRELQIAEQLQREIEMRRKELEYRFTAFTGDPSIAVPRRPVKY